MMILEGLKNKLIAQRVSEVQKDNINYDKFLKSLLELVNLGTAVEIMPCNSSVTDVGHVWNGDIVKTSYRYKQYLGSVSDSKKKRIHLYIVYLDFDDSIKYFDFPKSTEEENKEFRRWYLLGEQ